jgi:hypothetical protein
VTLLNEGSVPSTPVLVTEPYHRSGVVLSGGAAGFAQQHEGEKSEYLKLIGHELGEHPSKSYGFTREVDAREVVARGRGVAFGEDEVDGREHCGQSIGERRNAGDAVGRMVIAQLALGSRDALCHRGLFDEEGSGDLCSLKPAEQPKRQSDTSIWRQGRVTAKEDQPELVVRNDVDEVVEFRVVLRVHFVAKHSVCSQGSLGSSGLTT